MLTTTLPTNYMRARCIKWDCSLDTKWAWLSYQWSHEQINIHYFIFVSPTSYQLFNTADFSSFPNVFSFFLFFFFFFFFCHTNFFCLLLSSKRKLLLFPIIGHPFYACSSSCPLPNISVLDSLEAHFSPNSLFTLSHLWL